ncbi:Outer membrane receptor proteins, mostly Fe transport [Chryseobacterium soldanellicola]|uniref:Outer membrane receptor proteins, mostly Fe transport n=1 Tax=Chryseobacterium soldanellicola TaxID=311333 RepID=A0A1H1CRT0_9FLAO|nr:outer membrane beta-barrel family protein [Chryseobacterium soldanellicola]SDQ66903.1 Outer membrane receptor proteins, mostly Fe transport [Chryseobacterium soldanellicola]
MKQLPILLALLFFILTNAQTSNSGAVTEKQQDPLPQNKIKTIQEVTIIGKKVVVENKIDKIIYNVANDLTSQNGAAIDVLRKVPQVTVDADGNVELQGNPNVRFLINGKPSSIFGNSLADALASIPASQIKSIEAVTSPGAKYDAQGTGGIINIILNESKVKGINGLINMSAGTRFETGSLNLNFRNNNFSLNAFFSGNAQLKSRTPSSQDRISHDPALQTQTRLLQEGYTDFQRHGYRTGLGFDWSINKNNTLSGSVSYNDFANKSIGFINQEQYITDFSNSGEQSIIGYRNSDNRSSVNSIDGNLSYRKTFEKIGQELTADYVVSYGLPKSNYFQTQSLTGALFPYNGISGSNPGTDYSHNLSVDYVQPVNENATFEMGAKAIFQHITNATDVNVLDPLSGQYETDPLQSYRLQYDMKIYAGYLSSTLKLFNWLDIRAGARYEYTTVKIDFQNTNIPSYSLLVPSFILSHKFESRETVKLSYTRRVERPEYAELNPFLNFSDPHNITTGNPKLKPEIADNMEFGYSKNFKNGGNISFTLTERINSQDLKQITTFYPIYPVNGTDYTNVSVTTRENIGKEYNSGGVLSGSVSFFNNKLNIRGNMMLFHRYIVSHIYVGNLDMGFRYRLNLNMNYQFPKDFVVEMFGNYNSAAKNIQGKNPQSITYSMAARKQFWNKKASIGLTMTNPFNKYIRQITTVDTDDYSSYSIRELPLRSFGISFSYKFGKMDFKKEKDISNDYLNEASQGN